MTSRAGQLEEIARRRRVPTATYRLQFNRDFTLAQATEVAPYLRDLGISDCYASPLFQAGPQSTHGYDVCRFDEFNPAIGTRQDFETWSARLLELGLGLILDMVPNHMGADLSNRWWVDVLRRGRHSPFATYFDIDWHPLQSDLHDKILLPTLEDHYAAVLEAGKLRLTFQGGVFSLAFYDRLFPIAPRSVLALLEEVAAALAERSGQTSLGKELSGLLEQLHQRRDSSELAALDDTIQSRIDDWDDRSPAFHEVLELVCRQYDGHPNQPRSFDKLHGLLAARTRYGQDLSLRQLKMALVEVIATFPVYRTYATPNSAQLIPREQSYIEEALREAKARQPGLDQVVFDFIQNLLLLHSPADFDDDARRLSREFVLRFQQFSGPVMAKGVEDTSFYRFARLVSLNEVGGNPEQFGISLEAFHDYNLAQAESWPHALLATATHDTKRGEDVRARLNVLSEIPAEWRSAVQRWSRLNASKRTGLDGQAAPDPNDEYLLYQTLVGAWPWEDTQDHVHCDMASFRERVVAYMLKAVREAKVHTTWTDPNSAYEEATRQFTKRILDPAISSQFLEDFRPFQRKVAFFGLLNSLAQVLLKMTCPGVPDFYQGTELWDLSLVDPDNRRPVDYSLRRRLLNELQTTWAKGPQARPGLLHELLRNSSSGQVKLHLVWRGLAVRRRLQTVYSEGEYHPLRALGPKQEHVCAVARIRGEQVTLTIVPRLVVRLTAGVEQWPLSDSVWKDTRIELSSPSLAGRYTNALTEEEVNLVSGAKGLMLPLSAALASFPVALLERTGNGPSTSK